MDLLDDVNAARSLREGIHDENVGGALLNRGPQVVPASGGVERMLRPKNDCEVLKEMTVQECSDVHVMPDSMS